jgi:chromosome segregation ATPase
VAIASEGEGAGAMGTNAANLSCLLDSVKNKSFSEILADNVMGRLVLNSAYITTSRDLARELYLMERRAVKAERAKSIAELKFSKLELKTAALHHDAGCVQESDTCRNDARFRNEQDAAYIKQLEEYRSLQEQQLERKEEIIDKLSNLHEREHFKRIDLERQLETLQGACVCDATNTQSPQEGAKMKRELQETQARLDKTRRECIEKSVNLVRTQTLMAEVKELLDKCKQKLKELFVANDGLEQRLKTQEAAFSAERTELMKKIDALEKTTSSVKKGLNTLKSVIDVVRSLC